MNKKPLKLHVAGGNQAHLTKAEMAEMEKAEMRLGDANFTPPRFVRSDRRAHAKWKEITRLYQDTDLDLASSSDIGFLSRYCMEWSEYLDLLDTRRRLVDVENEWPDYAHQLPEDFRQQLTDYLKLEHITRIGNLILKKSDQLMRMEDRLFLNPLAKIKNVAPVPKKEAPADPLQKAGFGNL